MSSMNRKILVHVQQRMRERYGMNLTKETWHAWNQAVRKAVAEEGGDTEAVVVREIDHEGKKIVALCSSTRVLTVLVKSHAMRLFAKEQTS